MGRGRGRGRKERGRKKKKKKSKSKRKKPRAEAEEAEASSGPADEAVASGAEPLAEPEAVLKRLRVAELAAATLQRAQSVHVRLQSQHDS